MWKHWDYVAICKPKREASEETHPANTLILDFQPPTLEKKLFSFLLFNAPICGTVSVYI